MGFITDKAPALPELFSFISIVGYFTEGNTLNLYMLLGISCGQIGRLVFATYSRGKENEKNLQK